MTTDGRAVRLRRAEAELAETRDRILSFLKRDKGDGGSRGKMSKEGEEGQAENLLSLAEALLSEAAGVMTEVQTCIRAIDDIVSACIYFKLLIELTSFL